MKLPYVGRQPLRAVAVAGLLLLVAAGVAEAAAGPGPQASVLSVIAKAEVLPRVQLGTPTVVSQDRLGDDINANLSLYVHPVGGEDQLVHVEYSSNPDYTNPVSTAPQRVPGKYLAPVYLQPIMTGLTQGWDYYYRVVAVSPSGRKTTTEWQTFTANQLNQGRTITPFALLEEWSYVGGRFSARTLAQWLPGKRYTAVLRVERYDAMFNSIVTESDPIVVGDPSGLAQIQTSMSMEADPTDLFTVAIWVLTPDDGPAGNYSGMPTLIEKSASVSFPKVTAATPTSATMTFELAVGTFGTQALRVEAEPVEGGPPVIAEAGWQYIAGEQTLRLAGLEPATDYLVRVVGSALLHGAEIASEWVVVTTTDPTDAIRGARVGSLTADSATIEAAIDAGDASRWVLVEHQREGDGGAPLTTAVTVVGAGAPARDVPVELSRLSAQTSYRWRVVAWSGGHRETTPWATLTTPAVDIPRAEEPRTGELPVDTPATARLYLSLPRGPVLAGRTVVVIGRGLGAGERYAIAIGGTTVARGNADGGGRLRATVRVPNTTTAGRRSLVLIGAAAGRGGTASVQVVRAATLWTTVARSRIWASSQQRLSVRVAPYEPVQVSYRGKRISPRGARANAQGRYVLRFRVGASTGQRNVTVTGAGQQRSGSARFAVVR